MWLAIGHLDLRDRPVDMEPEGKELKNICRLFLVPRIELTVSYKPIIQM